MCSFSNDFTLQGNFIHCWTKFTHFQFVCARSQLVYFGSNTNVSRIIQAINTLHFRIKISFIPISISGLYLHSTWNDFNFFWINCSNVHNNIKQNTFKKVKGIFEENPKNFVITEIQTDLRECIIQDYCQFNQWKRVDRRV